MRDVPDFPQPGVLFRDITPLLRNQAAFHQVIDALATSAEENGFDAIVGIESRGFLFGAPLAYRLDRPFIPVRKAGKLPAPVMSVEYALEYGTSQLDIHKDALTAGQRVAVVDDVLATGGTALATAQLVELIGGKVGALLFLAELSLLGGRDRLQGYDVRALLKY
ncbi:MAG TPA: adenine phosphoribosyltransferase [Dehalococcoidia bacterium]|nr:adenine phosphoribosyltransferase [Dehalococcoidia bacterium]